MEYFFMVVIRLIRRLKIHVVMIALHVYFSSCGAAIAQPGPIKEPPLPPWNERAEGFDSYLKCFEFGTKETVYVLRPSRCAWVYSAEFINDGGSKGIASVGIPNLEIIPPNKMSSNGDHNQSRSNWNDIFPDYVYEVIHGALFGILISWPIMFFGNAGPYGDFRKPND